MPIKLATPAPLTFELRRDPGRNPFFYARERPEIAIGVDDLGAFCVIFRGRVIPIGFDSPDIAEGYANELHARLCTFEQPQPEIVPEPEKPRTVKVLVYGAIVDALAMDMP